MFAQGYPRPVQQLSSPISFKNEKARQFHFFELFRNDAQDKNYMTNTFQGVDSFKINPLMRLILLYSLKQLWKLEIYIKPEMFYESYI